MKISVVIATRDRRESLLHTLDRLAELPERPAVVVVDNGSSDGTAHAVRKCHPDARLVEARTNLGASARTLGAAHADTDVVAFADDDSWWAPGALHEAAQMLAAHPRLALVAARVLVEPGGRLDSTCERMRRSPLPRAPGLPGPAVLGFVACGAVVRRSAFLAAGGFKDRLRIGGEEELLAIDLSTAGWRLVYADHVVAHHRPSTAPRPGRDHSQVRNALWTAWLRRPFPRALARTFALVSHAGPAGARPLLAALRGLPWVLRQRRVVPADTERALRLLDG